MKIINKIKTFNFNFWLQHTSTHGALRLILALNAEFKPHIGLLKQRIKTLIRTYFFENKLFISIFFLIIIIFIIGNFCLLNYFSNEIISISSTHIESFENISINRVEIQPETSNLTWNSIKKNWFDFVMNRSHKKYIFDKKWDLKKNFIQSDYFKKTESLNLQYEYVNNPYLVNRNWINWDK